MTITITNSNWATVLIPTFPSLPLSLIAPTSPTTPAETRPTVYCKLIESLAKRHRSYSLQGEAAIYEPMHHMTQAAVDKRAGVNSYAGFRCTKRHLKVYRVPHRLQYKQHK